MISSFGWLLGVDIMIKLDEMPKYHVMLIIRYVGIFWLKLDSWNQVFWVDAHQVFDEMPQ